MQSKVIAIIVTYNGSKWIDKCFGSLVNSTIPLKILSIDNASTDGTPGIIREKFPQVEVIKTGQNLGFGKANNIGFKRVLDKNADYAFLLNQDSWIEPDTIEKLVNISKENPDYGIVSPIHLNGSGNAIDLNFQNYLNNHNTPGFYSDLYLNKLKQIYEGKYANAAAWLLTRNCIQKIGGFDPLFKHYGEDDDFINRLHSSGFKLAIASDAKIYHDRPQNGLMNDKFYKNYIYTQSLLNIKQSNQPKRTFLLRKIVADCFSLYFAYMGKNRHLKNIIKRDMTSLKIMQKAIEHVNEQKKGRAFL